MWENRTVPAVEVQEWMMERYLPAVGQVMMQWELPRYLGLVPLLVVVGPDTMRPIEVTLVESPQPSQTSCSSQGPGEGNGQQAQCSYLPKTANGRRA